MRIIGVMAALVLAAAPAAAQEGQASGRPAQVEGVVAHVDGPNVYLNDTENDRIWLVIVTPDTQWLGSDAQRGLGELQEGDRVRAAFEPRTAAPVARAIEDVEGKSGGDSILERQLGREETREPGESEPGEPDRVNPRDLDDSYPNGEP